MRRDRSLSWCLFALALLMLVLPASGRADDRPLSGSQLADPKPLPGPVNQWVSLAVDVEELRPLIEDTHSSNVIRSLAVLPAIHLTVPDWRFQPYLGAGLGLSLNGLPTDNGPAPPPLRVEESLVVHFGGGFAYHLGNSLALTGSARFAQFRSPELFHIPADPSRPLVHSGLDVDTYMVELGIRLLY
jgi:hypothetical protein